MKTRIVWLIDEFCAELKGKGDAEIIAAVDSMRRTLQAIAAAARRRQQYAKHSAKQLDLFEAPQ